MWDFQIAGEDLYHILNWFFIYSFQCFINKIFYTFFFFIVLWVVFGRDYFYRLNKNVR